MIGVVETAEAMKMALDAGLDLVEVAPDSDPPVCRILDYGKYKYEQSKKDKAQKAKSKSLEMKEVRLGRSMKIDPHDVQIRLNQARKFLCDGHKVQIVQNFRGREMMHKHRGFDRMKEIEELLSDIARVEVPPRMMGRRMNMIFAPDKPKVEVYKRKLEEEKKAAEAAKESKGGKSDKKSKDKDSASKAPVEDAPSVETADSTAETAKSE